MQVIWYLPSLLIGLLTGVGSGYWQMAIVSAGMVLLMMVIHLFRNRYPSFSQSDRIDVSLAGVAIANRVLPRREIFWKKQWQQLLLDHFRFQSAPNLLNQIVEQRSSLGFSDLAQASTLRYFVGGNSAGELWLDTQTEGAHLIIIGPTGSGKSELLRLICESVLGSEAAKLALFDFKGGACLGKFADTAVWLATDLDLSQANQSWQKLTDILLERERDSQLRAEGESEFLPFEDRIVVVVDELSHALRSSSIAQTCIEDISARGRSLGIHLVVAGQSLVGIPRSLLTNLRIRIAMDSADPIDLVQLGMPANQKAMAPLPGFGSATVTGSATNASRFYFPLGFSSKPKPTVATSADEQVQPARSQALRQMCSAQELVQDPPEELFSNHDSQLLSRMAKLR